MKNARELWEDVCLKTSKFAESTRFLPCFKALFLIKKKPKTKNKINKPKPMLFIHEGL